MDTIKLSKPLKVNGKDLTELPYDFDAITVDGFAQAEINARKKKPSTELSMMETDYIFHLYLGFEAVIAAEPKIDIADLERLTGKDVTKLMGAGRFFVLASAVPEDSSDEPSESTATSTDAAPTK